MNDEELTPEQPPSEEPSQAEVLEEQPFLSDREAFEIAIKENPEDMAYRLIFADWLDEHGEHEEADRQRKYPEAKKWIDDICQKHNADASSYEQITFDQFINFGHYASQVEGVDVEVYNDSVPSAIADTIPEFWKAWAVVTGLPLPENIDQKCYYQSGYCCAHEVYADSHVAGPKSEQFLRNEELWAQQHIDEEAYYQQLEQDARDQEAERKQKEFDAIQEELEQDRP